MDKSQLIWMAIFCFAFSSLKYISDDSKNLNPTLIVAAKAQLDGPYTSTFSLMTDNLRQKGLIPTTDPYYGILMVPPFVLGPNGDNSIVDWIFIRLRDKNNPQNIIAERGALIQKDGDIVEVDGLNPVQFPGLPCDDYFVEIGHRNHLAAGTALPIPICNTPVNIDFSDPLLLKFGAHAVRNVGGTDVLWAGDANGDGLVRFAGQGTDVNPISEMNWNCTGSLAPGTPCLNQYANEDTNMDGDIFYNGPALDVDVVMDNVLNHPANTIGSPTFPIIAQGY